MTYGPRGRDRLSGEYGRLSGEYGRGTVVVNDEQHEAEVSRDEVCARLLSNFRSPNYAPPVLPAAAMEVHRLSRSKEVKLEQVLQALERDPLLAARIVKAASSPAFGGLAIHSLRVAIMRIGMSNLAELVWEVALNMRVFRSKLYDAPMNAVRKHSTACAYTARTVAKLTAVPLDYAFLCGLLHDVGAAAALHLLGEDVARAGTQPLRAELLDVVLASTHAEASRLVASLWRLPDDMQLVLANHHTVIVSQHVHPVAAIIAVAERLLNEEGGSFALLTAAWDQTSDRSFATACDALGLNAQALALIKAEMKPVLARLEQAY